jgi:CHAD domain-containing protein
MAKARPIEGLRAEEPYAAAAAKVVAVRGREVAGHSRNVLDTDDIERLRAALEIFEPCFPAGQLEEALREVKEVADALGERRDADVTMAALERFADELVASDRPGIASLMAELRAEQAEANARLEAFVQPRRLAALSERLSELVMEAERLGAWESE